MDINSSKGFPLRLENIVPTDAVALLAGVSFGSVVKVFWALNAIHDAQAGPYAALLESSLIPAEQATAERRENTARFVSHILGQSMDPEVESALKLRQRFGCMTGLKTQ
jgi:hypothetical protein